MKRNLLLIITILTCFIFINTVKAEDIPSGYYTLKSTQYIDLKVVDSEGNDIKNIQICYEEYGCYSMTLQDNGLYKSDKTYTYTRYYSSLSDRSDSWEVWITISADGYVTSKTYKVTQNYNATYKLNGSTVIYDYTDSFENLDKVVLEKADSKKCIVVSGTGKNIGDEIACGTEHFYVMSNNGTSIDMMAKYNLYVGYIYNKITLDITKTYIKGECSSSTSCNYPSDIAYYYEGKEVANSSTWWSKIKKTNNLNWYRYYELYGDIYEENGTYYRNYTYKLYPYTYINSSNEGFNMQNSTALGVTGEKGRANYPLIGTLYLMYGDDYIEDYIEGLSKVYSKGYVDITKFNNDTEINYYLTNYKNNLSSYGIKITNIDLPSVSKINEFAKTVTNNELPLLEWYQNSTKVNPSSDEEDDIYIDDQYEIYYNGDLKESIPDKYSWLWNTSYWTKTLYNDSKYPMEMDSDSEDARAYFITSQGEICNMYATDCYGTVPRAGLRPVVTIATTETYNVYTKDDGNGTVSYEAADGAVKFTLTPNNGYVLGVVKVTDSNGNTITFTNNTFTMPEADVTIEATFVKVENPLTSDIAIITILILAITSLVIFSIQAKKFKKLI